MTRPLQAFTGSVPDVVTKQAAYVAQQAALSGDGMLWVAYVLILNSHEMPAFPTPEQAEAEAEAWVRRNFPRPVVVVMREV